MKITNNKNETQITNENNKLGLSRAKLSRAGVKPGVGINWLF